MDLKDRFPNDDAQSSRRLHLVPGRTYRVRKQFSDADGGQHAIGEEWAFIGSKFSRFEDEHIISIRSASCATKSFGLIYEESEQYEIIRHFRDYVTEL